MGDGSYIEGVGARAGKTKGVGGQNVLKVFLKKINFLHKLRIRERLILFLIRVDWIWLIILKVSLSF